MKRGRILAVAVVLILLGAGGFWWLAVGGSGGGAGGARGLSMFNMMRDFGRPSYTSLGQEIFLTGQDPQGRIGYDVPGMSGSGMMGGPGGMMHLSCAGCHGADGSGGLTFGSGVVSANLRQLIRGQSPPYDFSLFARAVTRGIDNQGLKLRRPMPHWTMPAGDLRALWTYVKTLQQ